MKVLFSESINPVTPATKMLLCLLVSSVTIQMKNDTKKKKQKKGKMLVTLFSTTRRIMRCETPVGFQKSLYARLPLPTAATPLLIQAQRCWRLKRSLSFRPIHGGLAGHGQADRCHSTTRRGCSRSCRGRGAIVRHVGLDKMACGQGTAKR